MERLDFDAIILKLNDNVGTSIKSLKNNTKIILKLEEELTSFVIKDDIKLCHKFSLIQIRRGDKIFKYGEVIGVATDDIDQGKRQFL